MLWISVVQHLNEMQEQSSAASLRKHARSQSLHHEDRRRHVETECAGYERHLVCVLHMVVVNLWDGSSTDIAYCTHT